MTAIGRCSHGKHRRSEDHRFQEAVVGIGVSLSLIAVGAAQRTVVEDEVV
jgi:hypothetical protein